MKVKDRIVRQLVDVREPACLTRRCYWPRPDPGVFTQGQGYRSRPNAGWVCGTREIHGCPDTPDGKEAA